ncbi:YncE family protein [Marininema halotolerans]|uniref:40-residue YVTN family beta-propeller repeat-containing protein n=1 Tax=Marininema halotolerans TaxID=1155944 RepID=A0A1I6SIQ3_9BACL|nr:YncE family protein [Marininema halotolerans]SFS76842.1 40-residue YVTN family beta-propeller repeat-containing protein [Marininema halotolerans]
MKIKRPFIRKIRPLAYVGNHDASTISVISIRFNRVITTFSSGGEQPLGVTVARVLRRGVFLYVANASTNNVAVFNIQNNRQVASIPTGENPVYVAIGRVPGVGIRGFVTNFESSSVTVFDPLTNNVIGPPIPVGKGPEGIALNPTGTKAFVPNLSDGTVSVINTRRREVADTIQVGEQPVLLAICSIPSQRAPQAYVANFGSNSVTQINTRTNATVGRPIPVGRGPIGVTCLPNGERVYVANGGSLSGNQDESNHTVSVVSTRLRRVVKTITVGENPEALAATCDGRWVYVPNRVSNTVSVIATRNNRVVKTIPVGKGPRGVAITPYCSVRK